jgi:hypothetical protein
MLLLFVGLTEKQTKGYELKLVNSVLSSGKAKTGAPDGFVESNFDAKYGEWLESHDWCWSYRYDR